MNQHVTVRPNIEQVVALRERALAKFTEAYDMAAEAQRIAHEGLDLKRAASNGYSFPGMYDKDAPTFSAFNNFFGLPERNAFMRDARWSLDANVWEYLIQATRLHTLMDKEAKDEIRRGMLGLPGKADIPEDYHERVEWERNGGRDAKGPPEVTADNLAATLEGFLAQTDIIWKRGIANVFSKLDRRFKSHDGWKIGSRIILTNAFDTKFGGLSWNYGYRTDHANSFQDIERVLSILDGKFDPGDDGQPQYAGIVGRIDTNRAVASYPVVISGDYFRVRIFKNGNAHIWFERDDLVRKVNKLLGEYYGEVIPADRREPSDEEIVKGLVKLEVAKNYGFFPTPPKAAATAFDHAALKRRGDDPLLRVLEPSAGTGNLARLAAMEGHGVDCVEIQEPLANDLRMNPLYGKIYRADFLSMTPAVTGKYDRVLMNPPFDRERDIDHVVHALEFLKEDGVLVAIMSAGTEFRETKKAIAFRRIMEKRKGYFLDLPPGSFASVGTYVNTVVCVIGRSRW